MLKYFRYWNCGNDFGFIATTNDFVRGYAHYICSRKAFIISPVSSNSLQLIVWGIGIRFTVAVGWILLLLSILQEIVDEPSYWVSRTLGIMKWYRYRLKYFWQFLILSVVFVFGPESMNRMKQWNNVGLHGRCQLTENWSSFRTFCPSSVDDSFFDI